MDKYRIAPDTGGCVHSEYESHINKTSMLTIASMFGCTWEAGSQSDDWG